MLIVCCDPAGVNYCPGTEQIFLIVLVGDHGPESTSARPHTVFSVGL